MRDVPIDPALVSVVIPTCNRASLLRRAIQSVLNQTYKNLEIIVVDDASTDDTRNIVEGFRDDRIRYFRHERNRGGSAARNTGIRAAGGAYIAFLDDDDEWEPEKTKIQVAALDQYDAVLCMSTIGSDQNLTRLIRKKTCTVADLKKGMPPVGGTSALMGRGKFLKELLFDETLPRCQDWDLLIRLAHRCTIGYVGKRLVKYNAGNHARITNAAVAGDSSKSEAEKRLAFFEKHRGFFGRYWYRNHVSRALLYGVRHRSKPLQHVLYVVSKCGITPVMRALARRVYQRVSGNV